MGERSTITQLIQLGPESVPGTQVAATKIMSAMMLSIDPTLPIDEFTPSGFKYDTVTVAGREAVAGKLTGVPTYTEMVYPLSSLFGAAAITTPSGGTASRLWTFNPSPNLEDTPKTFTVEYGSTSNRAFKFGYGLFTSFGFSWDNTG